MTIWETIISRETPTGPMCVHLFAPSIEGKWPAILFFSEIFQITGPIRRLAAFLAGQGFLVAAPEVYHEFEPAGTVLAYDAEGSERGNALKYTKPIAAFDSDIAALADFLEEHPGCNGRLGALGVCLGGHLAVRAAFHPKIKASAAFYPTDVHSSTLGAGKKDDTLAKLGPGTSPLFLVWGRQDPHVPLEGRRTIAARLEETGVEFEWHEFNAAHAFLRDEGPRYNPSLASAGMHLLLRFYGEKLTP